ncbi:NAD(P)H-dependent oxidoreductase [Amycolatopsis sp. NPDC051071]|uniref:NADPH-dependent FMN reductase n=1 Tax=Amycolatopsis sp. NPDC051071 TaxID=3154637 RepID=UPI00344207CF
MTDRAVRVALIIGSARKSRFTTTVATWFGDRLAERQDIEVDVVDLADVSLSAGGPSHQPDPADVAALAETAPRLAAADAFVVVTPEYNHSFPAVLKNFIDWHLTEWGAKPVGFVSHGGMSGGLRAVEHLRQVFAELHAVSIRETVSFHGGQATFGPDGVPVDADGCAGAAKLMIDQLLWWALALRDAKAVRPYRAG